MCFSLPNIQLLRIGEVLGTDETFNVFVSPLFKTRKIINTIFNSHQQNSFCFLAKYDQLHDRDSTSKSKTKKISNGPASPIFHLRVHIWLMRFSSHHNVRCFARNEHHLCSFQRRSLSLAVLASFQFYENASNAIEKSSSRWKQSLDEWMATLYLEIYPRDDWRNNCKCDYYGDLTTEMNNGK